MDHCGSIRLASYKQQQRALPTEGCHFIAQQQDQVIILYQAYKPTIAQDAVSKQRLDASPEFSLHRMTWAKPGFLWMMHRSGWASKPKQEHILALHVCKSWLFKTLEEKAILSTPDNAGRTKNKDIVIQWDPDHDWDGSKLSRRAIQIGMRGTAAAEFAAGIGGPAVLRIEDITDFVCAMRGDMIVQGEAAVNDRLMVPLEEVIELEDKLQRVLGMLRTAALQ